MSQQTQQRRFLTEVRGLAPGFLVGNGSNNRAVFPHVNVRNLREATPELLHFACALSDAGDRTLETIIAATVEQVGAKPDQLRRFARTLIDDGYLVLDPPPPRFALEPELDTTDLAPISDTQLLHVPESSSFLIDKERIVWCDHGGTLRLRLTIEEFLATSTFTEVSTREVAWMSLSGSGSAPLMSRRSFDELVERLHASGLLRTVESLTDARTSFRPAARDARGVILGATLEAVAAHERAVTGRSGRRVAIVPVNDDHKMAPLSLGLLLAYAQELDGGRLQDRYDFVPMFLAEDHTFLQCAARPAIFLFSNYIWNVQRNLELSAMIKAENPANLMIHGGPSTPKYQQDCEDFFLENAHVDITVRGEGEATFAAVLDALDHDDPADLSVLREVAGLSFRGAEGVVHTEDRERIKDLDSIPSPYLLGMFDAFGLSHAAAAIESNRGCPYGCTFCDWGSATLSRIRQFDMDRVKAELEWSSRNEIMFAAICDANFGILERDVEIAEYIATMKAKYGYPKTAALNYAKNTMKHLRPIIEVLAAAELIIEPTIALQTMDEPTLKIIRRSNIKTEKYNELATEFRRAGLPLAADIMMGLPGTTMAAFHDDLQRCTDRDVRARCNQTVLLPNSPMNEPSYREEHGIVARPHEVIKETKTYTRDEFEEMDRLRVAFYLFDNFGILRHVARFVRSEIGLEEVDFYDRISRDAHEQPRRWPYIASGMRLMTARMSPPSSWGLFMDDVGNYLTTELGIERGSAFDTTLAVQLAHLPAPSRTMPEALHLVHDFVAWHRAVLETRDDGHREDWEAHAPRLHTFPPGELKVSDPHDICGTSVGKPLNVLVWNLLGWDMDSPVARAN